MNGYNMTNVVACLNAGRIIDAIKEFRGLTGLGLKEAKDACEAIRDGLNHARSLAPLQGHYIVLSRYQHSFSDEYTVINEETKTDAVALAERIKGDKAETLVARVIAKTEPVTTYVLKDVA